MYVSIESDLENGDMERVLSEKCILIVNISLLPCGSVGNDSSNSPKSLMSDVKLVEPYSERK